MVIGSSGGKLKLGRVKIEVILLEQKNKIAKTDFIKFANQQMTAMTL